MPRRLALLVVVVAGLLSASAASAQVINACIKLNNGQVCIVGAAEACLPSETRASWNVAGPAGAPGAKGDTGAAGPAGP